MSAVCCDAIDESPRGCFGPFFLFPELKEKKKEEKPSTQNHYCMVSARCVWQIPLTRRQLRAGRWISEHGRRLFAGHACAADWWLAVVVMRAGCLLAAVATAAWCGRIAEWYATSSFGRSLIEGLPVQRTFQSGTGHVCCVYREIGADFLGLYVSLRCCCEVNGQEVLLVCCVSGSSWALGEGVCLVKTRKRHSVDSRRIRRRRSAKVRKRMRIVLM